MSPGDALAAARAQFGDVEAVRSELVSIDRRVARRGDGRAWVDNLAADLRVSLRSLRRAPVFSAAVIVTLGLGLGANAAMFTFLDRVYLRPPAGVADPSMLRRLWLVDHDKSGERRAYGVSVTTDEHRELADALRGEVSLALFMTQPLVRFGDRANAPNITITRAAADYLPLLGVRAAIGRLFTPDEAVTGSPARVVVISDALWRTQFGADPGVVGKTAKLKGLPFTIIGVAPPRFDGIDLERTSAWIPLGDSPLGMPAAVMFAAGNRPSFGVLARLHRGATDAPLETRATTIVRRREAGRGEDSLASVQAGSIITARGPGKERKEISIANRLGGVAAIVLLIACANIVNLLLARAVSRRREIAVRVALGISRARLVWLLSAESVILALSAGVVAVASAQFTGSVLRSRLVPDVEFAGGPLHWRVAFVTLLAALIAGVLAGLVPAFQVSRPSVTGFLKTGARDGVVQRSWLRPALVATQAALSVVLLVGAALFVSSLRNVEAIRLGYDVSRMASARVMFDDWRSLDSLIFARAAERVRRVPGVEDVALTTYAPMNGGLLFARFYTATDSAGSLEGREDSVASLVNVTGNYFRVTGMRIVRGRDFAADPGLSVIVNKAMAQRYWPGGDAIGQCMHFKKRENPCYTVIGIVEDAHRRTVIEPPRAQYYAPLEHNAFGRGMAAFNMLIRAEPQNMGAAIGAARRILLDEFPAGRPMVDRMEDTIAPAYRPFRLGALLFSLFGLLALVVAGVGVYSSVAYAVSQRTHEFGVRIALGATVSHVSHVVLKRALTPVVGGMIVGVGVALAAGRLIASFLYGITPTNAVVFVAVSLVLLIIAVVAAMVPATRAARVDPVIALRAD
jgi:predicted permease